jgi:hypothetical protein
MNERTVEIDGVLYNLTPIAKKNVSSVTFYYGCDSDCGFFSFNVLLNDDGKIWNDTQSITYYQEGQRNISKSEFWDNSFFLKDILNDNKVNKDIIELKNDIGMDKLNDLKNLLQKVHEKGWI